MAVTTFDPAKTDVSITLSNGNLSAAGTTPFFKSSLVTSSHVTTGKYYYEMTADITSSSFTIVGFGNATADVTNFLGVNNNSLGYVRDGRVLLNNVTLSTIMTWTAGDVISIAVDFATSKVWFRKNAGNWNNDVIANQNPATGVGGISFSTMNAGPYFAGMSAGNTTGDKVTGNFGASAFAQTAPSGFVAWGEAAGTISRAIFVG